MISVMKKLISLMLSLLICLSLLPGQAKVADLPGLSNPSSQMESVESGFPAMPNQVEGFPIEDGENSPRC